jgi:hypothetical protein
MAWLANFEDGKSIGGAKCHWIDLPKDKRITGVQMVHPEFPKSFVCLQNYDFYYFVNEATAKVGCQGEIVAEIIGGHDTALGVGTEVKMEMSGTMKIRTYPLETFMFDLSILHVGRKNGKPAIKTEP